jgi:hypothetical protein
VDPNCSQSILDRPHLLSLPVRLATKHTTTTHKLTNSYSYTHIHKRTYHHEYDCHYHSDYDLRLRTPPFPPPSLPRPLYDIVALKRVQYPSWSSVAQGGPKGLNNSKVLSGHRHRPESTTPRLRSPFRSLGHSFSLAQRVPAWPGIS